MWLAEQRIAEQQRQATRNGDKDALPKEVMIWLDTLLA